MEKHIVYVCTGGCNGVSFAAKKCGAFSVCSALLKAKPTASLMPAKIAPNTLNNF